MFNNFLKIMQDKKNEKSFSEKKIILVNLCVFFAEDVTPEAENLFMIKLFLLNADLIVL